MTLSQVILSDQVACSCFTHAFIAEKEEIMGLLLGSVHPVHPGGEGGEKHARIWASKIMIRSDKRAQRVEIPPEELFAATEEAEKLTQELGVATRVIGWYHSHPRITPYPSHVDLGTQGTFQSMETGWVGLIFSVFHRDSRQNQRCQIHCFQSLQTGGGPNQWDHLKIPVSVARHDEILNPLLPPLVALSGSANSKYVQPKGTNHHPFCLPPESVGFYTAVHLAKLVMAENEGSLLHVLQEAGVSSSAGHSNAVVKHEEDKNDPLGDLLQFSSKKEEKEKDGEKAGDEAEADPSHIIFENLAASTYQRQVYQVLQQLVDPMYHGLQDTVLPSLKETRLKEKIVLENLKQREKELREKLKSQLC